MSGLRAIPSGCCKASRERRRWQVRSLGGAVSGLLGGCAASGSGAPPSLLLDLEFIASGDVNPNERGQPAPILVRLFELRSREPFDVIDYYSLASDARRALGESCLGDEEFVLRPGERRRVRRQAPPAMRVLGVTAAYRDLAQASWRASRELPPVAAHWYDALLPAPALRARIQLRERALHIETGS